MMPFGQKFTGQKQNSGAINTPSPVRGLVANSLHSGGEAPGMDAAIWLYNMIPGEYGSRVRPGSSQFVEDLLGTGDVAGQVRGLMMYNSIAAGGALDHLFATNDLGIYEITDGSPTLLHSWTSAGGTAGWATSVNFTNVGGDHFLLLFDESNGYLIYEEGVGWRIPNDFQVGDPDPSELVQGVEWQGRMWFTERNSANAWYTKTAGGIEGDLAQLNMGSRFFKGGHLAQLAVWTVDDGSGMDDRLVAISSAGDVVVWELSGTFNPANPDDLKVIGRWFVGTVPEGRRVASNWGGDLAILTDIGVITLTVVMSGVTASYASKAYLTADITRYIRSKMTHLRDFYGWQFELAPEHGVAIISSPEDLGAAENIQFVRNTNTGAWCMFRGLDMVSMLTTVNGFFYGTGDGRVMMLAGNTDNVGGASGAIPIYFNMLTHYSDGGSPGTWKRPHFIRPSWIGDSEPTYSIKVMFDFDLSEFSSPAPPAIPEGAVWDTSIWDLDMWPGSAQAYEKLVGTAGMGRHIAIGLSGQSNTELSYMGSTVILDGGGLM